MAFDYNLKNTASPELFRTTIAVCLFCAILLALPRGADAYYTYFSVRAEDWTSSYYRESPDYEQVYENALTASANVSYSDRLSEPYKYPLAAYASGSFSLSSGSVKFMVEAEGYDSYAGAYFNIVDRIYPYWGLQGFQDQIIDVQLNWEMEGTYALTGSSPRNLSLYSRLGYAVDGTATPTSYNQYNLTDGYEAWSRTVSFNPVTDEYIEIGIWVSGSVQAYNSQVVTADFSGTGLLEVIMPEGAAFESDSGVLLTGGNAVPLPPALLIFGSGITALFALRRRITG